MGFGRASDGKTPYFFMSFFVPLVLESFYFYTFFMKFDIFDSSCYIGSS